MSEQEARAAAKDHGVAAYPLRHGLTKAERRTINAARRWRFVYERWLAETSDYDRDMRANGENRELSRLLDALQVLDGEAAARGR